MRKTTIEVPGSATSGGRRELAEPLGTTALAINHYRLEVGDGFPGGLHAHMDQEEVFIVLEGTAHFQTLNEEVVVDVGEAVRFGRGEFHTGRNPTADTLVALALGAPPDSEDIRIPIACPNCQGPDLRIEGTESGSLLVCPTCNAEHVPRGCLECGHELEVAIQGPDRTVGVTCPECGAKYEDPPFAR